MCGRGGRVGADCTSRKKGRRIKMPITHTQEKKIKEIKEKNITGRKLLMD